MNQWIAALVLAVFGAGVSSTAFANAFEDSRGTEQQKLVKDTADKVSAHLGRMKAPAGKEAQFKDLSDAWAAFKKTRETEPVPAVLAGKDDDAKELVNGIRKERYTKCQQLLGELGG